MYEQKIMQACIVNREVYNKLSQKHFKWETEIIIKPDK